MTYRTKYILLVLVNASLLVGFLCVSRIFGWDTKRRIADIDISSTSDFYLLVSLILTFLICFLANFLIISSRDKSVKTSGYGDFDKAHTANLHDI